MRRRCYGFTLIELMVASVAASILMLSAFQLYVLYHRTVVFLQKEYAQDSQLQILRMIEAMPYGKQKTRRIYIPK